MEDRELPAAIGQVVVGAAGLIGERQVITSKRRYRQRGWA
jgi:hypothetical protein